MRLLARLPASDSSGVASPGRRDFGWLVDEQVFIRVYMEITGESEGRARAVAMYAELLLENQPGLTNGSAYPEPADGNVRRWNAGLRESGGTW